MKLKKFYADSMQEALKTIKEELGSDAIILSSKLVRSQKGFFGMFSKKVLEVLAGYEERPRHQTNRFQLPNHKQMRDVATHQYSPAAYNSKAPIATQPAMDQYKKQDKKMDELDESIGELRNLINKFENSVGQQYKPEAQYSKNVMRLYNHLIDQDVKQELANELCQKTEQISNAREADPGEVLFSLIEDTIGKPHPIELTKYKQKVVMLIGPTGVGKTTTLVKLASHFVCNEKLNVGIINADVFRVAAQEHLKAYCEILNTEMITIYKPEEITNALEAFRTKDVIFLDTAGKVSDDELYKKEIQKLVKLGQIEEIYLTLSASTSEKVIKTILDNYAFLKIHNIIVTKVDEVLTKGMILNIANISRRPLSYMTIGQNVPDDIKEVIPKSIAKDLVER